MGSKGNPTALCEALEPRLFLSGSAWLDYLAASGQPLALVPLDPSTVGGAVVQAGEAQVYRFSAPGTGRLTVQVASDGSGLDPFLQIYNAAGTRLSQNDNARRGTLDSAATIWVSAGKSYYARLSGVRGSMGTYALTVTSNPRDDCGNTPATARTLYVARSTGAGVAFGVINYAGDADVRVFVAPKTGAMQVEQSCRVLRQGLSCDLSVYDAQGNLLVRGGDPGDAKATVIFPVVAGRAYYVKAAALGGTTGSYLLRTASTTMPIPANLFPPVAQGDAYSLDQDTALTVPAPGVLANDTDPDGGPLAALLVSGVSHGALALNADGSFTYTPAPGFSGSDAFTYKASDGVVESSVATATVTVNAVDLSQEYTPGSGVVTHAVSVASGTQLVVIGTDGPDTITLSQSGDALILATATGTDTYAGPFASVVVCGFAGDDTIRVTHSVSVPVTTRAGDGNDTVYGAGTGADTLYGGAGDDLLVSVGSGSDALHGEDGLDSFWADSTDGIADVSAAETAAGALHSIVAFYQPSTDPAPCVSLEIAGQDIIDPTAAYAYADFSSRPLFVDGPEYNDIRQGNVGDCYFLASLASLADTDPGVIRQMIAPMGDGTYAVRFYSGTQAVYVRVDGWLPASGGSPGYAKLTPENELWVALAEKAYAQFRGGSNAYSALTGGWMAEVYQALTGVGTNYLYMDDTGFAGALPGHLAAGHAASTLTWWNVTGPFYTNHAYMVKEVVTEGGTTYVTVYNTYGYDGRAWDGNPSDGLLRITLAQFMGDFQMVTVSLA